MVMLLDARSKGLLLHNIQTVCGILFLVHAHQKTSGISPYSVDNRNLAGSAQCLMDLTLALGMPKLQEIFLSMT